MKCVIIINCLITLAAGYGYNVGSFEQRHLIAPPYDYQQNDKWRPLSAAPQPPMKQFQVYLPARHTDLDRGAPADRPVELGLPPAHQPLPLKLEPNAKLDVPDVTTKQPIIEFVEEKKLINENPNFFKIEEKVLNHSVLKKTTVSIHEDHGDETEITTASTAPTSDLVPLTTRSIAHRTEPNLIIAPVVVTPHLSAEMKRQRIIESIKSNVLQSITTPASLQYERQKTPGLYFRNLEKKDRGDKFRLLDEQQRRYLGKLESQQQRPTPPLPHRSGVSEPFFNNRQPQPVRPELRKETVDNIPGMHVIPSPIGAKVYEKQELISELKCCSCCEETDMDSFSSVSSKVSTIQAQIPVPKPASMSSINKKVGENVESPKPYSERPIIVSPPTISNQLPLKKTYSHVVTTHQRGYQRPTEIFEHYRRPLPSSSSCCNHEVSRCDYANCGNNIDNTNTNSFTIEQLLAALFCQPNICCLQPCPYGSTGSLLSRRRSKRSFLTCQPCARQKRATAQRKPSVNDNAVPRGIVPEVDDKVETCDRTCCDYSACT